MRSKFRNFLQLVFSIAPRKSFYLGQNLLDEISVASCTDVQGFSSACASQIELTVLPPRKVSRTQYTLFCEMEIPNLKTAKVTIHFARQPQATRRAVHLPVISTRLASGHLALEPIIARAKPFIWRHSPKPNIRKWCISKKLTHSINTDVTTC